MIIGIDNISPGGSTAKHALGGMRHFIQSLVEHLPERGKAFKYKLFTPDWSDPFEFPETENLSVVRCRGTPRNRVGRVIYEQLYLSKAIQRENVALWLGTCNTLPLSWKGHSVLFAQSLQYFTRPRAYSWTRRSYLRTLVPLSIRRADRIVAFSKSSKEEIVRRFTISPKKIDVIYHALRFSQGTLDEHNALREKAIVADAIGEGAYILSVSAFYPYKNLQRLLEAFALIKPYFPHRLVFIGGETSSLSRSTLVEQAQRLKIDRDVFFLGRVADGKLPAFYRHASLMAMPSLDETFGFPLLEAMAFGCPVVTSEISCMPEISGDAAVLVDPHSVGSIANGLRGILTDEEMRDKMISAGRMRAKFFTYDRFFAHLITILDNVRVTHLRREVLDGKL